MIKIFEWEDWTNAKTITYPPTLIGEWRICIERMGLKWLRFFHTKTIVDGDTAYNTIFGFIPTIGKFKISESHIATIFNYGNGIVDMVRLIHNNKLIGKLFIDNKFICYFTMERILKDGGLVTSKTSEHDEAYSV